MIFQISFRFWLDSGFLTIIRELDCKNEYKSPFSGGAQDSGFTLVQKRNANPSILETFTYMFPNPAVTKPFKVLTTA